MLLLKSFLLTLLIFEVSSVPKYYWRNYDGRLPYDAVVAARTKPDAVYIGRVPFENQGFLVGPIIGGFKNIIVTQESKRNQNTAHSVDKLIEILCSPLPHIGFKWVNTTSTALLSITGLVEAGYEGIGNGIKNGVLYIGRAMDKDVFKIGKVVGYYQNSDQVYNLFFYANGEAEYWKQSFEVLAYEETNNNVMCPISPPNLWHRDYYWRQYTGNLPEDAVVVGTTRKLPTYITRAAFENEGSLVAPLVQSSSRRTVNTFTEILCSPFPNRFRWVKTHYDVLANRSDLVQGGFEDAHIIYIGRVQRRNEYKIKKINLFGWNGHGEEYEVLTYSDRVNVGLSYI